jgi:hypothetical protein
VGAVRVLEIEEMRSEIEKESREQPGVELKEDGPGCVLYRSGKGGRPLGVVMERSELWRGGLGFSERGKKRSEEIFGEERIGEERIV